MNKTLLLALCSMAAICANADQVFPESGKFYKVQHSSGLYLTQEGAAFTINDAADSLAQVFKFVNLEDSVFRIHVDNFKYMASDSRWNATVLTNSATAYVQFDVAEETDSLGTHYLIKNLGQLARQGASKCYLGTDGVEAGSYVYTDKNGKKANYQWTFEEVADFDFPEDIVGPDVYPDNNLPDDDPRKDVYPGYKLVFAEEFNATEGQPDKDIWTYEKGWRRNNEDQYYTDYANNIWFENGVCVFNGRLEDPNTVPNPSYDKRHGTGNYAKEFLDWTSSSIITKGAWDGAYSWLYGIYEVRAKIPAYTGCWPAIWSTGRQYSWPKGGEIDLMEWYGNCIHGNVCWGNTQWNSAVVNYRTLNAIDPETEWGDQYHIWRMFWDYDHIEMWCDDVLVNNIDLNTTYNPVQEGQQWSGVNPFRDVRQVLWLNLALGGNSGGSLANCPQNNYYLVDYARIYQRIGTDGAATYHVDEYAPDATIIVPDRDPELNGISCVEADDEQGEAEYYNLQGVRVPANANLKGIYIVKQGAKASKVNIR